MNSGLSTEQRFLCDLCANALFGKNINLPERFNIDELFKEAKHQTVFPISWVGLRDKDYENSFYLFIVNNVRINHNHIEISRLLSENNIPCVILKGVASASYYKEPATRTMGDVDIMIHPCDIEKVNGLLQELGYSTNQDIYDFENHIAYKRNETSVCEVHFHINGIPEALSDVFDRCFENIFDDAKEISVGNGKCLAPSDFHHGIILLLHTATHLTSEGIGLRHLCDWAVFVNGFMSDEFVAMFEKPLKEMGLWRFAQLLTLCCTKFLGVDYKEWTESADGDLLFNMISDILNGGNFGMKDTDRYGQIKYISNRETNKVNGNNALLQVFSSINSKAKSECKFARKCKILIPFGWLAVICKYFILVLSGKRKIDNIDTINTANHRKNIYNQFKLFEPK